MTRARDASTRLIRHPWFDRFMVLTVFVSSACLMLDSPRSDPNAPETKLLKQLDLISISIFTVEFLLKNISRGLIGGPHGA